MFQPVKCNMMQLTNKRINKIEASFTLACIVLETVDSIKKVQVGKDQEKAQSEKDSHSKNRGGKKPN